MLEDLARCNHEIIFLQLGGNDVPLAPGSGPSPASIANNILLLARVLLDKTACNMVYVGQLLFRDMSWKIKNQQQKVYYNDQVIEINRQLSSFTRI